MARVLRSTAPHMELFITTNNTGNYGSFSIDAPSQGNITLRPPTSGTYAGMSIFIDRNAPYSNNQLNGNDKVHIEGTLYMPSVNLTLQGGCDYICNQLIVCPASLAQQQRIGPSSR